MKLIDIDKEVNIIVEEYALFMKHINRFREKHTRAAGTNARRSLLNMGKIIRPLRKKIQDRKQMLYEAKYGPM